MKWLKENNCPWDAYTFEYAGENGNLSTGPLCWENMKWLLENNCPWDTWTFAYAAKNGNLSTIKRELKDLYGKHLATIRTPFNL